MCCGISLIATNNKHKLQEVRDIVGDRVEVLSLADEVVMVPIYPAREEPIEGITTEIIAERVTAPWSIVERETLAEARESMDTDVVVTFGAGNIDAYCDAVAEVIKQKA